MPRGQTMEKTVAETATTPEEMAIAEARARDDALFDEMEQSGDSGELAMTDEEYQQLREANDQITPEQMRAEAAARARMGLGGALGDDGPAPLMVATYDANGEPIDVEAVRSARSAEADAVMDKPEPRESTASKNDVPLMGQVLLPGFPAQQAVHEVVVNLSGRAILNLQNAADKAIWESLTLGARVELEIDAVVTERAGRLTLDSDLEDKKRVAKASLKVVGFAVAADEDDDDSPAPMPAWIQELRDQAVDALEREPFDEALAIEALDNIVRTLNEAADDEDDTLAWDEEIEAEKDAGSDSSTSNEEPKPKPGASALGDALAIAGDDDGTEAE